MKINRLPIATNVVLSTDCRIANKLAIIQTSSKSDAWLATHMDVVMNRDLNATIGNGIYEAKLNYFDDILVNRKIDFWGVLPSDLCDVIACLINRGEYVMLDIHTSKRFPESPNSIQSLIIYGYDYNKMIYNTLAMHWKGFFQEVEVPVELINSAFADVREHYMNNPDDIILRHYSYYPLGTLKLRDDYNTDNALYDSIAFKIGREFGGESYSIHGFSEDGTIQKNDKLYYTGVGCLLGIINTMTEVRDGLYGNIKEISPYAARASFVLHEHRKRIHQDMKWIIRTLNWSTPRINDVIEQYFITASNMEVIHNKFNKLAQNGDCKMLNEILKQLMNQYTSEKLLLMEFMNSTFKYYTKMQSADFYMDTLEDLN